KDLLAYDLDTQSDPIAFPCVSENDAATLTVKYRRMTCQLAGGAPVCFDKDEYATENINIAFRKDRSFCTAVYDTTGFKVDDLPPFALEPAMVTGMKLGPWFDIDPGVTPQFEAQAYRLVAGTSSYPNAATVFQGWPF